MRLPSSIFSCALFLSACTPTYDWREFHGTAEPFTVLMPAKPIIQSRIINLPGSQVTMTMSVAETNGTMFAVGTAETPDAVRANAAIQAMKTALVSNINGKINSEKTSASVQSPAGNSSQMTMIEIEAVGIPTAGGDSRVLFARFVARDKWVYQAVVAGTERSVTRDTADTFFSSFKPH